MPTRIAGLSIHQQKFTVSIEPAIHSTTLDYALQGRNNVQELLNCLFRVKDALSTLTVMFLLDGRNDCLVGQRHLQKNVP